VRRDKVALPAGWAVARLGDIAKLGPPLDRCLLNDDIEVNFVPMRAVEPEGGGLLQPERRAYRDVKKGYTSFLAGDVISAKITPCMENGKTAVVPDLTGEVCFGSTEFHVLRPVSGLQARWIAHFLLQHETRRAAQRSMTGGVGQMRVPGAFLEALPIPVAPSKEQERIADTLDELFSDLDAAVAALQRVRAKLKLYRAAVLKAAVEGSLTAEWREQHPDVEPASRLLQRILDERRRRWEEDQLAKYAAKRTTPPKNWKAKYQQPKPPDASALPSLPHNWCCISFDQMASIQGGLQKSPARRPMKQHYPYLRVANVQRGALDLEHIERFELTDDELSRLRLAPGDLLIVEGNGSRAEIGRCALWKGEIEPCVHQNHIIRVRPIPGINATLVDLFINSPLGQTAIQLAASSTSGLHTLSIGKIAKLTLPLPSEAEQQAIVEAVEDQLSVIDHLEADLDAKLASAQALRQSILRDAFAGKLVPQDPNDEPASELLKRIAAERSAVTPKRQARTKVDAEEMRRGYKRSDFAMLERGKFYSSKP
jgi:type I restriction enzyme S subunit